MFDYRPSPIGFRGFLAAVCLALLAACGGSGKGSDDTANPVPAAPTNLKASASDAVVTLSWSASSDATSYHVKRATTSGGPYTQLAAPTSTGYTDSTPVDGTTYYYVVSAVDAAGESANSSEASATPEASAAPAAPTDLKAVAGNGQVSLTWSASAGATSYDVERASSQAGPYTQIAAVTSTSYTDATVTNGAAYYYMVTAGDSAGDSTASAPVVVTPDPTITTPAIPLGLAATAGDTQVSLTWSASAGATGYHVKRATTSGGPYTQIAAPTSTAYVDTSLTDGTTYYYVVSAVDSAGESANSAEVDAVPAAPTMTPATPTGISATPGNDQVSLTWSASNGATGYNVKRATVSGGPYTQVSASTSTSFTDTSVTNGTTYYYVVSAVDSAGESTNSVQVKATPTAPATIPSVPTGLSATPGNAQISLTWSASNGATSYNVKRATTSGGPYSQVGAPSSTAYTDTSLNNGTTYYYVVSALDSAGESANSAEVSATPAATVTIPAAPSGLNATAGNGQVALSWSASSAASSYNVKRSTSNGGPYTQLSAPTSASYTDTAVTNGTTYYYVVSAVDSAGESDNSSQVSATPAAPALVPAIPTGLTATSGNASVTLSWSASSGATSYHVKRSTTNGSGYVTVSSPTTSTYTDSGLSNGTTYYYVVTAVDAGGESASSSQVSATPSAPSVPAVPSGLTPSPSSTTVVLTWSAVSGATSYHVKRSTTSGSGYTQIAAPTTNTYTDTGLNNGTTYYYVVSALNAVGESANSSQVLATPTAVTAGTGTWYNVTPAAVDLTDGLDCGNYGTQSAQADTSNPGTVYTEFMCQGIWRSTDYGQTWTGPINTGTNGATVGDCAGGITVSPNATKGGVPTIYEACIRGSAIGFWKSVDGGVNWVNYQITADHQPYQDIYPPVVDPYDPNHLLVAAHEQDYLVESTDGGVTWTNVTLNSGMDENGGTGAIFFINTGNASSTRNTWLWMAQGSGGLYGTWRTADGGTTWTKVDNNEHPHGSSQIYQPDTGGVVFMAGTYSALGNGVLKSTDYGQTWTHVSLTLGETIVTGTPNHLYSMYGYPIGIGGTNDPAFQIGPTGGVGTWTEPGTPNGPAQGTAQFAVLYDGTHYILVGGMWNSGVWRYIEP